MPNHHHCSGFPLKSLLSWSLRDLWCSPTASVCSFICTTSVASIAQIASSMSPLFHLFPFTSTNPSQLLNFVCSNHCVRPCASSLLAVSFITNSSSEHDERPSTTVWRHHRHCHTGITYCSVIHFQQTIIETNRRPCFTARFRFIHLQISLHFSSFCLYNIFSLLHRTNS